MSGKRVSNKRYDSNAPKHFCRFRISCVSAIFILIPMLLSAGCGGPARLRPAPTVRTVPGDDKSAVAAAEGVRMVVETDKWSGNPGNLEQVVAPLRVTIENRSEQPLRIRYNEFTLTSASGFTYAAIPPYKVEGSVTTPTTGLDPHFTYSGFYYAPYYRPYFRGLSPWRHPWAYDPLYYHDHYNYWRTPLPTDDMLEMAIPEGVLEPEGRISGFIYFQRLDNDLNQVTFNAGLVNAQTGDLFGSIGIPFTVK